MSCGFHHYKVRVWKLLRSNVCIIQFVLILQDAKVREQLGVAGVVGKIENRMLTVVSGPDMVNITYLNFMAFQDELAKVSTA